MLRNYLTIAVRNLLRHKGFSLINTMGLAIGMAACLLIWQFVSFELSYDDFHEHKDQIYRVKLDRYNKGELGTEWAGGCGAIGPAAKAAYEEIEAYAKLTDTEGVMSYEGKDFREQEMFYASDSTLRIFSFDLIEGNPFTALSEPFTAVITASTAKKYFGEEEAMGKVITKNGNDDYRITGVVADPPANSHIKFSFLFSFKTYLTFVGEENDLAWQWDGFLTYLKVRPGTDPLFLADKLDELPLNGDAEYLESANHRMDFSLQPLKDIYLYSHFLAEAGPTGNGQSVYFLGIIAFFILIIAWINYINLSTARAVDRAREVGMRKVIGASRGQLIRQFLLEAMLVNSIAGIISLTLTQLGRPFLVSLTSLPPDYSILGEQWFWLAFAGMFVLGAIFSGLYPAFVLSSFKPVDVMKGRVAGLGKGRGQKGVGVFNLRRALVVFQFAASTVLIAGTLSVSQQLNFMKNQDLGLNYDQTLVVKGPSVTDSTLRDKIHLFHESLRQLPRVQKVSGSGSVPGATGYSNAGGIRLWGADDSEGKQYEFMWVDAGFIDLYEIGVAAGRAFDTNRWRDTMTVIFNEVAVQHMGFASPEDAIGKEVDFWGDRVKIIGVVKNFHHRALTHEKRPFIFRYWPFIRSNQNIKLSTTDLPQTLKEIENAYQTQFPGNPFEYFFVDDHFDKQYKADRRFGQVFGIFSVLAILVACMGLFGLASFTVVSRTREIGIRKILGASVGNILLLLNREFVMLILIANAVAIPLSWWGITQWLEQYPYKMSMAAWLFLVPMLVVIVIALLTVSYQIVKTARSNPSEALRYE